MPAVKDNYIKLDQNYNSLESNYSFVRFMEKGSVDPFLIFNPERKKSYVVKELSPDENALSRYLDRLSKDGKLPTPKIDPSMVRDDEDELVVAYSESHPLGVNTKYIFYLRKNLFAIALMRLLSKNCSPKGRIFGCSKEENSADPELPLLGLKFLSTYKDWSDIFKDGKVDGYPIDEQGYVVLDSGFKKPIRGIGICAVLNHILKIGDMHAENWGLLDCGEYYQLVIIDAEQALENYSNEVLTNAAEILEKAFVHFVLENGGYVTKSLIPEVLRNASYVQQEVYFALERFMLLDNTKEVTKLIDAYFSEFPELTKYIQEEIKNSFLPTYTASRKADAEFLLQHLPYQAPRLPYSPSYLYQNSSIFFVSPNDKQSELEPTQKKQKLMYR